MVSRNLFRSSSLLLSIFLLQLLVMVAVPRALAAEDTGKVVIQQLVDLFERWSNPQSAQAIFVQAANRIDYGGMAKLALRPVQWDRMSEPDRHSYITAFRHLVENHYYPRWHKLFLRSKLQITNEEQNGPDTYVNSYVTRAGEGDDEVVWRLRPGNGGLRVISLNVNGKDLLTRIGPRFQKQYDRRGPAGLISWINHHTETGDEESGDEGKQRATASTH